MRNGNTARGQWWESHVGWSRVLSLVLAGLADAAVQGDVNAEGQKSHAAILRHTLEKRRAIAHD
ncbi:hypothetical protein ACSD7O_24500 [Methylorubrum extorquens]|jgi:hypothetical protein|uniref:hypothetical protein n=1 Tax=Methylorubrum extorquens TaxID=408 RepID=UPI003F603FE7